MQEESNLTIEHVPCRIVEKGPFLVENLDDFGRIVRLGADRLVEAIFLCVASPHSNSTIFAR